MKRRRKSQGDLLSQELERKAKLVEADLVSPELAWAHKKLKILKSLKKQRKQVLLVLGEQLVLKEIPREMEVSEEVALMLNRINQLPKKTMVGLSLDPPPKNELITFLLLIILPLILFNPPS